MDSIGPLCFILFCLATLHAQNPAAASDGCSSRGAPGYRLPNNKCVSWAQHEKNKTIGDFPIGASCEHPQGCSLETAAGVKRLERGQAKVTQ